MIEKCPECGLHGTHTDKCRALVIAWYQASLSSAKKEAEDWQTAHRTLLRELDAAESSRDKYKKALEKFKIYMISAKDTYSKKDPTRVVWETAFNLMIERFAEVEEALKEKEGV